MLDKNSITGSKLKVKSIKINYSNQEWLNYWGDDLEIIDWTNFYNQDFEGIFIYI